MKVSSPHVLNVTSLPDSATDTTQSQPPDASQNIAAQDIAAQDIAKERDAFEMAPNRASPVRSKVVRDPMHKEVDWYIAQWEAWTTPEAIAAHPRFHEAAEAHEAKNRWLKPTDGKGDPFLDPTGKHADGGAAALSYLRALRVEPHPDFVARLAQETTSLENELERLFNELIAKSHPPTATWTECLEQLPSHIQTLRDAHKQVQSSCTYGALLDTIPAFTTLANAEYRAKKILDGIDTRDDYAARHVFRRTFSPGWVESSHILGSAPARLSFPTFADLSMDDFPALPVWPVALARGPQSFDGRKNKSPGDYAEHDVLHTKYLTANKITARGGRGWVGYNAEMIPERRELEVLVRTARREEIMRQFWRTRIREVEDPNVRLMLQLALFAVIHETEKAVAPTKYSLAEAVCLLERAITGPSLTDGTTITKANVRDVAAAAIEWVFAQKIRAPDTQP